MADLRFNVDVATGAAQAKMSSLGSFLMKTITSQVAKPFDEAGKIITKSVDIAGESLMNSVLNPMRNFTNTLEARSNVKQEMKQEFGLGLAYMPQQAMQSILNQRFAMAEKTQEGFSRLDAISSKEERKALDRDIEKSTLALNESTGGRLVDAMNWLADTTDSLIKKLPW